MTEPARSAVCPACGASDLGEGYDSGPVPVTSSMLMDDRSTALAVPSAHVTLAHCGSCGFITNTSFDPDLVAYTSACEDSQSGSAAFREWSRGLARDWVHRHGLRGRPVVEVGCGKGDFLVMLVEEGVGGAVGIDPAAQPGRHGDGAAVDIEWLTERYAPEHARIPADAVVCRHTLEHIPDVRAFVELIAGTHATTPAVTVLMEVPDTARVLREGAFWDVYYEHCSYFTPGSLSRLFRRAGFVVDEARLDFDDQYIVLAARRGQDTGEREVSRGDELDVSAEDLAGFARRSGEASTSWARLVTEVHGRGGRVAIWGAGSKGVAFLAALGDAADHVAYGVDVNPRKWDHFVPGTGHEVVSPERTVVEEPDLVIVMNPVYREEIRQMLADRDVTPQVVALGREPGRAP